MAASLRLGFWRLNMIVSLWLGLWRLSDMTASHRLYVVGDLRHYRFTYAGVMEVLRHDSFTQAESCGCFQT